MRLTPGRAQEGSACCGACWPAFAEGHHWVGRGGEADGLGSAEKFEVVGAYARRRREWVERLRMRMRRPVRCASLSGPVVFRLGPVCW